MKVAIIADLHFGVKKGNEIFLKSQLDYFENQFVNDLHEKNVNTIFILGDVFDTRQAVNVNVQNTVQKLFKETFADFDVHILVGNHDLFFTTTTETNSLKFLDLLPNVTVYETIKTRKFGEHTVAFIPWITDYKQFLESDFKAEYGFGHFEICGMRMDRYNLCAGGAAIDDVWEKLDHVYTGHFHTRSCKVNNDKDLTYVGSPYQITRTDRGDERGCTILDLDTNETELLPNKKSMQFKLTRYPEVPEDIKAFTKGNVIDVEISNNDTKNSTKIYQYVQQFEVCEPAYPVNVIILENESHDEKNENVEGINLFSLFKKYIDDRNYPNKDAIYNECMALYNSHKGD